MERSSAVPNQVLVRFVNPTTNKALHMGHIRGAYLGSAAAACFNYLGSRVATHCILEDVGPYMGLAVLGLEHFRKKGVKPVVSYPKMDHEAHAYYIQGARLCSRTRKLNSRAAPRTVQLWTAKVPDNVLVDWARGSPHIATLANEVRDLAVAGQSRTLEQFAISVTYRDFESAETPYLHQLLEDGIQQGIFRRLKDGGVLCNKPGAFPLRCANVHYEESAYLLSFLYRSMKWNCPGWAQLAFAGEEWLPVMKSFPAVLEKLGIKRATQRYRLAFYGMLTAQGNKISSRFGRGLLADKVLKTVKSLPAVASLVRTAKGILSRTEVAALLLRLYLLDIPSDRDVEFSMESVCDSYSRHWQAVATIAALCGRFNRHYAELRVLKKRARNHDEIRALARAATVYYTFEPIVEEVVRACEEFRRCGSLPHEARESGSRIAHLLQLLGTNKPADVLPLDQAPSFLASCE